MPALPRSAESTRSLAPRRRRGLSLVELIVVILILAVLAGLAIPQIGSGVPEKLEAAAEVIICDLELARSLAVSNSSRYYIAFDKTAGQYTLKHVGSNTELDVLPASPFHRASDDGKALTAHLANLPSLDGEVQLLGVQKDLDSPTEVSDIEFNSLGGTTRSEETIIWLAAGRGADRRFLSVVINPTTGLADTPQPPQESVPTGLIDTLVDLISGN